MRRLLMTSYWIGIVADGIATILLFSPRVAALVLQTRPIEATTIFQYVSYVAGALMLGWTVLLFWAQRRPIERADILLITLFPVVTVLAGAATHAAASRWIPLMNLLPLFVLYVIIAGVYIPSYRWAKHQLKGDS